MSVSGWPSHVICGLVCGLNALPTAAMAQAEHPHYDVLITHARIVDGTGAPWFIGDIGISADRIAAIGDLRDATATTTADATGLVASPGFIDVQGQSEFNILVDNRAASKITQGVTTEITGEGSSIAPANARMLKDRSDEAAKYGVTLDWHTLADYFRHFERTRSAINPRHLRPGKRRHATTSSGKPTVRPHRRSSIRCGTWSRTRCRTARGG